MPTKEQARKRVKSDFAIGDTMRVAVVGLGHQSIEDHIPAVISSPDVELVAVVEPNEKTLACFKKQHPTIRTYSNVSEMIDDVIVDFAIVATPHATHFEICKALLSRKIHVLKEKPMSLSVSQARTLAALAAENSLSLSVTLQRRFNPIYTTFFQLIDKIGHPFYIEGKYTFFTANPGGGWRGKRSLAGGGCLIDMGYHIIDLIVWYFGLPDSVIASHSSGAAENPQYDAEDTARINFIYAKKRLWGSLLISRVMPPKTEYLEVYGTRGFIRLERGKIERFNSAGESMEALTRQDGWPSAAQDQIEYFVKVVRRQRENIGGADLHLNHMAFIEAAYHSSSVGKYVSPRSVLEQ